MTRKFTFLLMALLALAGFKSWGQEKGYTYTQLTGLPESGVQYYLGYQSGDTWYLYVSGNGSTGNPMVLGDENSAKPFDLSRFQTTNYCTAKCEGQDLMSNTLGSAWGNRNVFDASQGYINFVIAGQALYHNANNEITTSGNSTQLINFYKRTGSSAPTYTVTLSQNEGGELKASKDGSNFTTGPISAEEGATIFLDPDADPFYEFDGWITTPSELAASIDETFYTFEMPAYDVIIEATYIPRTTYAIEVNYDSECGTASVTYEGVAIGFAPVGLPLTLSATPDADHVFDYWRIYDGENEVERLYEANTTFAMIAPDDPSNPLIFEAYFGVRPTYRVNISNTIQNGTVVADPTSCYSGTTVTLTPQAANGYQYMYGGISVVDGSGHDVSVNHGNPTSTFTMPESDVTVSATFKKLYNVSMGTVQNGSAYAMPGSAVSGASVSVYVTPNTGCVVNSVRADYDGGYVQAQFEYTTEYGQRVYMFDMPEKDVTVNVDIKKTYTVSYTQSTGGTFSVSPAANVMESQRVNIDITGTDLYYSFDYANYESKISVTDASGNPVSVNKQSDGHYYFSMPNSNATVSVTFDEDPKNDIDVIQPAEGCTISVNPFTNVYYRQNVQLTYELEDGFSFVEWVVKDGETPIQVYNGWFTMPNSPNVTVTATVELLESHTVSIDDDIVGGNISTGGVSTAYVNETVHLSANPYPGYEFVSWTVTAECGTVEINNNSFIMPNCDVTVSATFLPAITVYDGTNTNQNTAVFTYYGDTRNSAAQFIVPAEQLEAMAGGTINSMKFYVDSQHISLLGNLGYPTYAGYITEGDYETPLSSFIFDDVDNIPTNMFNGHVSLTNGNSQLIIDFVEPYAYNGGDLAIAFKCTEEYTENYGYTTLPYYGTSVTNGGIYRTTSTGSTPNNFIPKTTFYYTPGEVVYYDIDIHSNGVVTTEHLRKGSTLEAPENIPAGLAFCGWTTADIATYTDEAPDYVTKAIDVTDLYAVFSYSEAEQTSGQNWVKITSPSELIDGQEIVLVYNNSYVMGERQGQYSMNYYRYAVSVADDKISNLPSSATIFTLEQSSGKWKLHYNDFGTPTTLSYNTNDGLANYGLWLDFGCYSYDEWTAEGTSNVIFRNNYNYEYIGEDESEYSSIIHSVANANLACQAFKKDVALVTYYMTEVLTNGTVANATFKNIIVVNPITVSGRLEMNANGLFRNENVANFVFADGAQFYYTGTENVKATFKKEIEAYQEATGNDGYYLIANPTNETAVANLASNNYDLYTFDPAGDGYGNEWINMKNLSMDVENGIGYLYANDTKTTLEFAGVLNPAGSTVIELTYADAGAGIDFRGFNLIGNPYACNAYVGESFYVIQGTELTLSENAYVAPCEGFFVEATAADQSVTLSTTVPKQTSLLSLTVSQNRGNVIDRAIVRFDGANDLHKFMLNPQRTNIRLAKNGEEFAAISSENEGEIPVSFKAEKNGTYTITVNTENVEANYLHLIDNLTGMDTDLLNTPSYTFNASTSDYAYRFKLVFSMTDVEENESNANSFAYISNGNLVINNIEGEATMQIVDMLGRVVSTEIVSGSYNKALNLKAGLYIINLNGMTQKIVVK